MPAGIILLLLSILIAANDAQGGNAGTADPRRPGRIVGGRPAEPGEFPWAAALYRRDADPHATQFCGAALVAPDWVATAAHCLAGRPPASIGVQVGGVGLGDGSGETLSVIQTLLHPAYDPRTGDADLALLQLDRPVNLTFLRPLPPERQDLAAPGSPAIVLGWGAVDPAGTRFPDTLQATVLPLVSAEVCNAPEAYNGQVSARMLCAGYPEGTVDACRGDSGGPLVIRPDGEGPYLAGIISWGDGCAQPNKYGVYTNVAALGHWIENQLGHPATLPLPLSANQVGLTDGFLGLAVQSLSRRPLTLDGRLLDPSGFRSSPVEVSLNLPPTTQRVFLTQDLGGGAAALLALDHPREDVVLTVMAGDWTRKRLDGLVLPRRGLAESVFPWGGDTAVSLTVFNPQAKVSAELRITWHEEDGTPVGTHSATIPSQGLWTLDALPGPDRASLFRLESSVPVVGWAFYPSAASVEALPALEPRLMSRVFLPDLTGPDSTSPVELTVFNAGPFPCRTTLELLGETGDHRRSPSWVLPPGGFRSGTLEMWMAEPLPPDFRGAGRLSAATESSHPCRLAGTVRLAGIRASAAAPLPERASDLVLPYVVDSPAAELATWLAVFNPGPEPVSGRLQYFRGDGSPGPALELYLAPEQRLTGRLRDPEWFGPGFQAAGGHLRLSCDGPVAALGLLEGGGGSTATALQWVAP